MPIPLVSEQDFEREVLRAEVPVLVDLFADWCQPCKQLTPILEQIGNELSGKLKIIRVDVEKSPLLARSFRVQSIPMLVLIAQGRPVDQVVGLVDKKTILEMVQPFLPTAADEIAPKDLQQLIALKRVVPVDVRDAAAFARYRIPGAINLPKEDLLTRARELAPTDGRLRVLYGRTSDDAKSLAEAVRNAGIEVAYLVGGFLHWEADGGEVERGG
ncbi:MAG TPA: thioredoxin domain-containing protein [Polyangiales bacterium]|nr:thioredoxin domain-containing protein [Polyangiales bacterium]